LGFIKGCTSPRHASKPGRMHPQMATVCTNTRQASTRGSGKCHNSRDGVWRGRKVGGGQGRIWGSLQGAPHHATRASQAVCTPKWQRFVRIQCRHQPEAAGSATTCVMVCGWGGKWVPWLAQKGGAPRTNTVVCNHHEQTQSSKGKPPYRDRVQHLRGRWDVPQSTDPGTLEKFAPPAPPKYTPHTLG
jgi:hypothetical protein